MLWVPHRTSTEETAVKVENAEQPSGEQIKAFLGVEGPVCMVNLLRFRERAKYADGRVTELSGREAYALYATAMRGLVEGEGGRFVFGGDVAGLLIGEIEDPWDAVGIVEYPTSTTLLSIASSPAYAEIEVHRHAGLAGQLNITTQGDPFAG